MDRVRRNLTPSNIGVALLGLVVLVAVAAVMIQQDRRTSAATDTASTTAGASDSRTQDAEDEITPPGTPAPEVMARLDNPKRPFTVAVIGDSTGAAGSSWVVHVGRWLGETYDRPATLHPWFLNPIGYGPEGMLSDGPAAPITIWNGSASGQSIAYSRQHLGKMIPGNASPDLIFFNHGHNLPEGGLMADGGDEFVQSLSAKYPDAALVIIGQNPQTAKAEGLRPGDQQQKVKDILFWADYFKYPSININKVFRDQGDFQRLIDSTGIHPTDEGYRLWGDAVIDYLEGQARR